ncbi:hypothetical protein GCM10011335_39700 [Aureimonas glaciei]|uniref:Uncharacterized protein n=1 Tax=Aureimonas glaciei TaxID=1776957 RepID=A0A916Y686_9HYPH|nr:hypothetical protein GCM10011335_39700 [Aureimonas glaciei]
MRLDRRTLLGAVLLTMVGAPVQAELPSVLRVSGDVTAESYKGLETFLLNSMDTVVGLKISFPQSESVETGDLNASADDGKFVAYLSGPDSETEIVANEGFSFQHGSHIFDGFFVVKSGGMNQGIISLFLEPADEASVLLSGAPVKDISIDRLDPTIRKQD